MLPERYDQRFAHMLGEAAFATADPVSLVPFWPIRGSEYDGRLLVVGRSVNGWVRSWPAQQLRDPASQRAAVAWLRADAEPDDHCRMGWVVDLWGRKKGYNTRRSAFWRVLHGLSSGLAGLDATRWSSWLAWTNLYKVSPEGWNPGGRLQRAQRQDAVDLLRLEIEARAPERILALTGRWIDAFSDGLELEMTSRAGLVEAVGFAMGRPCVVAAHPMGKPGDRMVAEVTRAFADLGVPLS